MWGFYKKIISFQNKNKLARNVLEVFFHFQLEQPGNNVQYLNYLILIFNKFNGILSIKGLNVNLI